MRINKNVFNIDFAIIPSLLLPTFLRCSRMIILLHSCMKPILYLKREFTQNRNDNIYKAEHNGQVCYLRKMLNDKIDVTKRRIYITDSVRHDAIMFHIRYEDKPVIFEEREKNQPILFTKRGIISDIPFDFIVYCPVEYKSQEKYMRSFLEYYKLASKNYNIEYF